MVVLKDLDDGDLDEDLEGSESMLEPQVILQNEAQTGQVNHAPLHPHYLGQPCNSSANSSSNSSFGGVVYDTTPNSSSHFLFDESQSSSCSNSNSKPRCVVCSARNPNKEHLANHFMQELIQDLEGETICSQCPNFDAPDGRAL